VVLSEVTQGCPQTPESSHIWEKKPMEETQQEKAEKGQEKDQGEEYYIITE